jgi:two-component system sensor histidine kinase TctE
VTDPTQPLSIQRRLLLLLLGPVAVLLLSGALIDYLTGLAPLERAYDLALADTALAVANRVQIDANQHFHADLPEQAIAVLRTDSTDSIFFEVMGPDGAHIIGDAGLIGSVTSGKQSQFGNGQYQGHPIRLATRWLDTSAGRLRVTVAETSRKRLTERSQLLFTIVSVDLVQLVCILLLVWWAVRYGFSPFRRLGHQIANRSPRDLSSLDVQSVPLEVADLVQALNRLFTTLHQSGEAQQSFLANAAHQLRTPLTGLQAQLQLLLVDERAVGIRDRIAALHQGTLAMTRTTNQLLALARTDPTVNLHLNFTPVSLPAVIEEAVKLQLERAIAAEIDLGADISNVLVVGSQWMLQELLANLLDNALLYAPRGGVVTARCAARSSGVILEVEDNGPGVPAAERAQLTRRFFRGGAARGGGSGLGLAIVEEICTAHGATLSIASVPEFAGMRVTVLFSGSGQAGSSANGARS